LKFYIVKEVRQNFFVELIYNPKALRQLRGRL
jgi:hypothetical protein